jgi:hypothetical protein
VCVVFFEPEWKLDHLLALTNQESNDTAVPITPWELGGASPCAREWLVKQLDVVLPTVLTETHLLMAEGA